MSMSKQTDRRKGDAIQKPTKHTDTNQGPDGTPTLLPALDSLAPKLMPLPPKLAARGLAHSFDMASLRRRMFMRAWKLTLWNSVGCPLGWRRGWMGEA